MSLWDNRIPLVVSQEQADKMLTAEANMRMNDALVSDYLPPLQVAAEQVLRAVMLGTSPSKEQIVALRKLLPAWCSTSIANNPKDPIWDDNRS
jgi:hypothetical protein